MSCPVVGGRDEMRKPGFQSPSRIHRGNDGDDVEEEEEVITEYEKQRLKMMERNEAMLASLQIPSFPSSLAQSSRAAKPGTTSKPKDGGPPRRSERLKVELNPNAATKHAEKAKGKDPNAPKRPATDFFIFMETFRKTFKDANPELKLVFVEAAKAGGTKWKQMSDEEKALYTKDAEARWVAYQQAVAKYKNANKNDHASSDSIMILKQAASSIVELGPSYELKTVCTPDSESRSLTRLVSSGEPSEM